MPDETAFQRIVARLDYPMHIVTMAAGDRRAGCLVGFATQCSISPPRYWVCISKANHTLELSGAARAMAVHLPFPDDHALAELFGSETGDEVDKFARCEWEPGPDGTTPVLTGCPRWFFGAVVRRVDVGDHVGHLIEVDVASETPGGSSAAGQLGFQDVKDLPPGHDA